MSIMRFGLFSAGLVSVLCAASGCIFQGGDEGEGGAGGSDSTSEGASNPGDGGGSSNGGNGSGGGAGLDGVGPSSDPSPDASAPGEYVCSGCPEAAMDLADADAGTETVFTLAGKVADQLGHGSFLVLNESGQFLGGGLLVDPDTGDFSQVVPLFCGTSLIKAYFQNAAGISTFVKRVTNSGCLVEDVRVTAAWDETTRQWTTHLVRFGGTIQDQATDCHDSGCGSGGYPDWGVSGDAKDNPVMDTYAFPNFMGVENINYPGAEDGLTVLVENAGTVDGLTPRATLYINLHDKPTYVKQIPVLKPQEVLIAADIDGAAGILSPIDEIYNCAAEFSAECEADLP